MSVLIKGMQIPRDCKHCKIAFYDEVYGTICPFSGIAFEADRKRQETCPLVEVPTPHGMLIDGDELYREVAKAHAYEHLSVKRIIAMIRKSPTVIEAEE